MCILSVTFPVSSQTDDRRSNFTRALSGSEHGRSLSKSTNCDTAKDNYPVIIAADRTRSLLPLTYLDYFKGYPALIFTEPQNSNIVRTILKDRTDSSGCERRHPLLLVNKGFDDFILELAVEDGKSNRTTFKDDIVNFIVNAFNREIKVSFSIESDEVYSFFTMEPELKGYKMQVDEIALTAGVRQGSYKVWQYLGTMKLSSGRHFIEMAGNHACADKKCLRRLRRQLRKKIVAIPQSRIEGYAQTLKSNDIRHLFYVDKDSVQKLLRDKLRLDDSKRKGIDPFTMDRQQFYVPFDGNYSIKALLKPIRDFVESDVVSNIVSNGGSASLEAVSGWDITTINTSYEQDISGRGLRIDANFGQERDVNEAIVLSKKFPRISIKERPYLLVAYDVEKENVQDVEIDIEMIDSSSWFFKTKKITLNANNENYVVNLYEQARGAFGHKGAEQLSVEEVVLKFKKRRGIDISNERGERAYTFLFKNIAFLEMKPIIAEFDDRPYTYMADIYYYFDKDGNLKQANFMEQIPSDVASIYKLRMDDFVDLKENPVLLLRRFPKPIRERWGSGGRSTEWKKEGFSGEFRIIMKLDLDGDAREDKSIEVFASPVELIEDGKTFVQVNAYEETKKKFPGRGKYHLLSIGINFPDDAEVSYQLVETKKLMHYKENIYGQAALKVDTGILKIDDRAYKELATIEGIRSSNGSLIELNNIYMKEGLHNLDILRKEKFHVELIEIRQDNSHNAIVRGKEPPQIEFEKINPTRYVVNVERAKEAFTLVFSESFHEGWKAYVRKSGVRSQESGEKTIPDKQLTDNEPWSALWSEWKDRGNRIEIENHFMVNGYANGWIVPVGQFRVSSSEFRVKDAQDFEVVLEYKPQRLFEIGLLVSGTTLFGCIIYWGYHYSNKKKLLRKRNFDATQ